jgi:hypothetical protein
MKYSTTDGSTPNTDPTLEITGSSMVADASHLNSILPSAITKTLKIEIDANSITPARSQSM